MLDLFWQNILDPIMDTSLQTNDLTMHYISLFRYMHHKLSVGNLIVFFKF